MGFSFSSIVRKVGHAVGGVVKSVTGGTLARIVPPLALVVPTKQNLEGAAAGLATGAAIAGPVAAFTGMPTVPTAAPATLTAGGGGPIFPTGGATPMATAIPAASGGGFNLSDLLGLAGQVGTAFGIKELAPFDPTRTSAVANGGGITTAGINIPITGTSPVETAEVADYCLPKDPQRRRMREWLIRASINAGIRVTPKKILSAVKLLGIEGTALALNVNRPLAAPFVQPAMVSAIVIEAMTRRRRRRCVISRRDVSQVRRTARAFASLSSDLASLKAGRGRAIAVRSRHKAGCGCVVCKRRYWTMKRVSGTTSIGIGTTVPNVLTGQLFEFAPDTSVATFMGVASAGDVRVSVLVGTTTIIDDAQVDVDAALRLVLPDQVIAQHGAFRGERITFRARQVAGGAAVNLRWAVNFEAVG